MNEEEIELMYPIIMEDFGCECKLDDEGNTFYVNYDYDESCGPNICSNVFLGKIDVLKIEGEYIPRDINAYYYILNGVDVLINTFNEIINSKISSARIPDEDDNILEIGKINDNIIISIYDSSNSMIYKSRPLDTHELEGIVSELLLYTDEDFISNYNAEYEML